MSELPLEEPEPVPARTMCPASRSISPHPRATSLAPSLASSNSTPLSVQRSTPRTISRNSAKEHRWAWSRSKTRVNTALASGVMGRIDIRNPAGSAQNDLNVGSSGEAASQGFRPVVKFTSTTPRVQTSLASVS
ncbi:hypothetical protein FRC08_007681 [Ceratobasidium sp. 394]|nr:hypothetical protein FRC08_007681 [Ceratobasidium sp. 394]